MAYTKNTWANGDVITADKLNHIENGIEAADTGGGLTDDIRAALIQLAAKVAYIDDDGAEYYGDLYDALYAVQSIYLNTNSILINTIGGTSQLTATTSPSGATVTWSSSDSSVATVSSSGLVTSVALGSCTITATAGSKTAACAVTVAQKTLSSISAVYTQSGTVYTTDSLDSLKSDLVVTAHWSDNTTSTVSSSDYTLSGTLTAGTSTVTVSYGGKTTTFNVTVTAAPTLSSISAVYTQSGTVYDTDSLDSLKADLVVTATYSDTSTETVPSTDYTLSGTLTEGTSVITVSYSGKTTTFNVTVTAVPVGYTLKLSDGDFQLNNAVIDSSTIKYSTSSASSRRTVVLTSGDHPFQDTSSNLTSYYPISVPDDAYKVTISITPNTQYVASTLVKWNGSYYTTVISGLGWNAGGMSYSFAPGVDQYITINCKYNSAGTSYPTNPSEIVIEFETPTTIVTYNLTDGITKLNAGITPSANFDPAKTSGEIVIVDTDSSRRRAFVSETVAYRDMKETRTVSNPEVSDLTDTTYYPFQIPSDATGAIARITPSTQYMSMIAYTYDSTNHYVSDGITGQSKTGWSQGQAYLSFTAGSYYCVSISSKYDSAGSSYPTDVSELTLTFIK